MSSRKFKFVSPGVFLKEIDNSQLPKPPGGVGPVIIGRTRKGPALKPVIVPDMAKFVEIFGDPIPGGESEDVWRDGNGLLATGYAPYAAQAYLTAKGDVNSPVTMVRLLGVADENAGDLGEPGWQAYNPHGIFLVPTGSAERNATLVSIVYGALPEGVNTGKFKIGFEGTDLNGTDRAGDRAFEGRVVKPAANNTYTLAISSSEAGLTKQAISLDTSSEVYIRNVLNTNPVSTNSNISSKRGQSKYYWLGETFDQKAKELAESVNPGYQGYGIVAIPLNANMADFKSTSHAMTTSRSGWMIPQHIGDRNNFQADEAERLFRIVALHEGEQGNRLLIKIEDITISDKKTDPYGTFTVKVYEVTNSGLEIRETYPGCNLNPNSANFVAREIGDQYIDYDSQQKRNRVYGSHPNISSHVRVELGPGIEESGPERKTSVPFGYLGPVIPKSQEKTLSSGVATFDSWAAGQIQVKTDDENKIHAVWPSAQTILTASIDPTARQQDKLVLGVAPYVKTRGGANQGHPETLTNVIDKGFQDYLRAYSSFSDYLSAQQSGIKTTNTVHSHVLSLDNVVVNGSNLDGVDESNASILEVMDLSGSHRGIGSVTGTPAVAAEAALVLLNSTTHQSSSQSPMVQWDRFTLNDGTNTVGFMFHSASTEPDDLVQVSTNFGTYVAFSASVPRSGRTPAQNLTDIATNLVKAINLCDGASGRPSLAITAATIATSSAKWAEQLGGDGESSSGTLTSLGIRLVQTNAGVAGNTAISKTIQAAGAGTVLFSASFAGGADAITAGPAINSYTATFNGGAKALCRDIVGSFFAPMAGGFDGVDITEADPFNNSARTLSGKNARNSYAYASVERALNVIKDAEFVEYNLAAMPGITNVDLTEKLIQNCEARGDALAIIDLPDVYQPPQDDNGSPVTSFQSRLVTNPTKAAKALRGRQLNSSYGAAYYPWVKIRTQGERTAWVPPSVVALGVMANTEKLESVWFAPAGFNRGGLNSSNAGIPVVGVTEHLLSKDRDTLYDANINPIASFVTEGLVIFGQKTLQETPSALDRINVRRLLIFVKKLVSRISNNLIFDQNLPATWNRFKSQVVTELEKIKTNLGLADFKVILDETTTTPDLIDRNIMYAKIFLKPARAIEFIAVDFVITNSGAAYDD